MYTKDILPPSNVELFPFRDEADILNRELLELAAGEGSKGLFVGCTCTTDVMDKFMSASIIQFVSTNLTNRLEQICVVSIRVLECSDGSRHRFRTALPRKGSKSVDPRELRQLKMQGWTTKVNCIGARLGMENNSMGSPAALA
jgi:hypothetical protein